MSQLPLRSVRLNARSASTLQSFVGTAGEIFYDSTNQTLRVYPGNIAAGKILADRDWVNSAIGDIGTSSLVNGTRTVSLSTAGSLTIPGDIRSEGNINIDINLSDSTLRRWQFGEDGSLTLPSGGTILNSSGQPYVNGVSSINTSVTTSIFTDASGDYQYGTLSYDYAVNGVSNSFSIEYSRPLVGGNVDINVGNTIVNGDLTLSGDIKSNGNINIDINLSDSTLRRWQFGEDGALTFPDGTSQTTAYIGGTVFTNLIDSADSSAITVTPSTIFSSDVTVENDLLVKNITLMTVGGGSTIKEGLAPNLAGGAIILTPAFGANDNQALVIYPTAGEGNHIHLTANGGTTELYLGDDSQYVKLVNGGNVEVRSSTSGATAAWIFDTEGRLTFPAYPFFVIPEHSYGKAGDTAGMVIIDDTYIYYCTADYVNNATNIWRRTPHAAGTW